jgi:hypothetical protein
MLPVPCISAKGGRPWRPRMIGPPVCRVGSLPGSGATRGTGPPHLTRLPNSRVEGTPARPTLARYRTVRRPGHVYAVRRSRGLAGAGILKCVVARTIVPTSVRVARDVATFRGMTHRRRSRVRTPMLHGPGGDEVECS